MAQVKLNYEELSLFRKGADLAEQYEQTSAENKVHPALIDKEIEKHRAVFKSRKAKFLEDLSKFAFLETVFDESSAPITQEEVDELEKASQVSKTALNDCKAEVGNLQDNVNTLTQDIIQKFSQTNSNASDISALKMRLKEMNEEVLALQKSTETSRKYEQLMTLRQENQKQRQELDALATKHEDHKKLQEQLNNDIESLRTQIEQEKSKSSHFSGGDDIYNGQISEAHQHQSAIIAMLKTMGLSKEVKDDLLYKSSDSLLERVKAQLDQENSF